MHGEDRARQAHAGIGGKRALMPGNSSIHDLHGEKRRTQHEGAVCLAQNEALSACKKVQIQENLDKNNKIDLNQT